ncbi:MAG TPA: hypothetical protein VN513_04315 [Gemmatimonadales bacterium]|nr:hypothetical protein [Gemmatimonadaceae bacterium]HXE82543.1 hypothetical protein [Gemmatimonadales bacterium]
MRTPLMQLVFATIVAATLSACDNADSSDLVAPTGRPSTYLSVGPTAICTPSSVTSYCQLNSNIDVSAGDGVTCSLRLNGAAFCWGTNAHDMLGNGGSLTITTSTPTAVAGGHFFSSISVGETHVCAIERNTGAAYCWGLNDAGQLGDNTAEPMAPVPVAVLGGHAFSSISAGAGMTCGVSSGTALCWGLQSAPTPTSVQDLQGVYASISVGNESPSISIARCGLATAGQACEGGGGPSVQLIAQGGTSDHFCFIDSFRTTKCWGNNYYGQLGGGTSGNADAANWVKVSPVTVSGNHAFESVATGGQNTCALSNGAAFCWGWNNSMQLGTNTSQVYSWVPQAVLMPSGTAFRKIAVGDGHACAIDNGGSIWCWGRDDVGQTANVANPGTPTKVFAPTIS